MHTGPMAVSSELIVLFAPMGRRFFNGFTDPTTFRLNSCQLPIIRANFTRVFTECDIYHKIMTVFCRVIFQYFPP